MTQDEQDLILHTFKALADSQRREVNYRNEMLDMLLKELNVHIPERRSIGDRRENQSIQNPEG